jgi:hypothetical protein
MLTKKKPWDPIKFDENKFKKLEYESLKQKYCRHTNVAPIFKFMNYVN